MGAINWRSEAERQAAAAAAQAEREAEERAQAELLEAIDNASSLEDLKPALKQAFALRRPRVSVPPATREM